MTLRETFEQRYRDLERAKRTEPITLEGLRKLADQAQVDFYLEYCEVTRSWEACVSSAAPDECFSAERGDLRDALISLDSWLLALVTSSA